MTQIASLPTELGSTMDPETSKPLHGRMRRALERFAADELEPPFAVGVLATSVTMLRLVGLRSEARRQAFTFALYCRESGDAIGRALFELFGLELSTTGCTVAAALDLYAGDPLELRRPILTMLEERPAPERAALPLDWHATTTRNEFEATGWDVGLAAGLVVEASWTSREKPRNMLATLELQALTSAKEAFERAGDEAGCRLVAVPPARYSSGAELHLRDRDRGARGRRSARLLGAHDRQQLVRAHARPGATRGRAAVAAPRRSPAERSRRRVSAGPCSKASRRRRHAPTRPSRRPRCSPPAGKAHQPCRAWSEPTAPTDSCSPKATRRCSSPTSSTRGDAFAIVSHDARSLCWRVPIGIPPPSSGSSVSSSMPGIALEPET